MAHGAPTAVAPSYSDTVQLPIPALLPPAMPSTGWTMQQPPYHQLTTQPTVLPMATDTLPPVPAQYAKRLYKVSSLISLCYYIGPHSRMLLPTPCQPNSPSKRFHSLSCGCRPGTCIYRSFQVTTMLKSWK